MNKLNELNTKHNGKNPWPGQRAIPTSILKKKKCKFCIIIVILIMILLGLFSISLFSQDGLITIVKTDSSFYYQCPKVTDTQLGIMYPYQVAYIWEYWYYDAKYKTNLRKWHLQVGENNNVHIPSHRAFDMKVTVTSYYRSEDYITGVKYKEFYLRPKEVNKSLTPLTKN